MSKPVIGVIPLYDIQRKSLWMLPGYLDGIQKAGGVPLILPLSAEKDDILQIAQTCDGFLFPGGQDVDPALFGEPRRTEEDELCPQRDRIDEIVFRYAFEEDKPSLGICRGIQFFNAILGGTLYQDLPTQFESSIPHHMDAPYDRPAHDVEVVEGTPLCEIWKCRRHGVNSCHHQGVRTLAKGLEVMARADDGLVEALFHPQKKFFLAVQWHPEFIYQKDPQEQRLFEALVKSSL